MDKKALIETLRELQAQLEAAENVDDQTLAQLQEVTGDLTRLGQQRARASQEDVDSITGRLQNLLVQFEADHPRLTSVLQQVIDGLANLGI
jgi:hypothetical protein